MGKNRYKLIYDCGCGCDWGGCGRKNHFLLEYFRGSDTFSLFHKEHSEENNSELEHMLSGTDETMNALIGILKTNKQTAFTKTDEDDIKMARGW